MPITPLEYNIPDLDPLSNPADLVSRYLEVADASGKNNKVGFPAMVQVVADNLPGANALKSLIKSVKCYDTTDPQYYPGNSTLVMLDPATLCGGTLCYVEFPKPSRMYRLHIDANGPIGPVSIDGDFNGNTNMAKW